MTTYAGGSAGQGQGRPTTKLQAPQDVLPANFGGYPEAGKTLYSGTMVGQDAAGNIVDLSDATNPAINVLGILRKNCVNVSGTGDPGATGLAGVAWGGGPLDIQAGGWTMVSDGTITSTTPLGTDLYAKDNQTVSTENGGGAYLRAGWFCGFDAFSNPFCVFGPNPFAAGSIEPGAGSANPFFARAVITSIQAYGGSTTGTLTETANAALAAQDGVTIAVGDVVWLQEGTTNITAASDAGPYVVTALGGAAAKWSMTRPSWWATGSMIPTRLIDIGPEGTFWKGTQWKSFAVKGTQTVDATAPLAVPGTVAQSVTLVAGTATVTNVPILSSTKAAVGITRTTANTSTLTTGGYGLTAAPTAGAIGTATFTINAQVAAGTINNADISTVSVSVTNW